MVLLCDRVTDTTPQQRRTVQTVTAQIHRALDILRREYPHEPTWRFAAREWSGRVDVGTRLHVPEYARETGCLRIGLDTNGSHDLVPLVFTRCFLALVKATTGQKRCTDTMLVALDTCRKHGIEIDLQCDDIKMYSLTDTPWYDQKGCGTNGQDGRRWTFPELIGRRVDDAVAMLRAGYPHLQIRTMSWDTIHTSGSHGDPNNTVIIVVDPWSKKVVYPEPHVQSMGPQESLTDHCFMLSDEGTCLGAPRRVPDLWRTNLIGASLGDATNSLRWEYPHAVVETQPETAAIDPIRRRDRIRVLFDPETGKTTRVLLG